MKSLVNLIFEFIYCLKFKSHINKVFSYKKNNSKDIIIVETQRMYDSHIAVNYVVNTLSKKYPSKIAIYKSNFFKNNFHKFILIIFQKISFLHYGIYNTFGNTFFLYYKEPKEKINFNKLISSIKNKNDLLNFKIDNILIGDLIYDTYLRWYGEPTIEINDPKFVNFLCKSIKYYYFCKKIFKDFNVKSVILSHAVYIPAILGRIALEKNISFYNVTINSLVRLGKDFPYSWNFKYFKEESEKTDKKTFNKGIIESKLDLKKRIKGIATVGLENLNVSPFAGKVDNKLVKKNNKIKILVATHCFYDSPHVFGKFFFNDMYEWLNYLGKISQKTDYDWYLKLHPNKIFAETNKRIILHFVNKYKKFKVVEPETSHFSFVGKIDYVLSIHGNISQEYALFNIPVITGRKSNGRFTNYNFNINPKSFQSYNKKLLNLKKNKKIKINKKEIYAAHFANKIYFHQNYILNFHEYANKVSWKNINGYMAIKYWLENFNEKKHEQIIENISKFIDKSEKQNKYARLR